MNDCFITENGGVKIEIPADKVSWFDLKNQSRIINSEQGGWNTTSHWVTRGISSLNAISHENIQQWTLNSLTEDGNPIIRINHFQFDRHHTPERQRLIDLNLAENGNSLDQLIENAINAQVFRTLREHTRVAYEVPLVGTSNGGLNVDLVSISGNGTSKQIELIELKKATNQNDSPLFAFLELVCYGIQLVRCWEHFCREVIPDGNNCSKSINLTIAAPQPYYNYWFDNNRFMQGESEKSIVTSFNNIIANINEALQDRFPFNLKIKDVVTENNQLLLQQHHPQDN